MRWLDASAPVPMKVQGLAGTGGRGLTSSCLRRLDPPRGGLRAARGFALRRAVFTCRHCARLGYACARESGGDRLMGRGNRIRQRLGWDLGMLNDKSPKPEGDALAHLRAASVPNMMLSSRFGGGLEAAGMPVARSGPLGVKARGLGGRSRCPLCIPEFHSCANVANEAQEATRLRQTRR